MVLAAFALVVAQRVSVTWLGFDLRSVTGMSLDGSVVVGNVGLPWSPKPVVWTAQKGAFNPCATGGQEYGWAFGVSLDGRVVVGSCRSLNGPRRAFRWTFAEGVQDLGVLPEYEDSVAECVSRDGTEIGGFCSKSRIGGSIDSTAFRWTAKGMEDLGKAAGGTQASLRSMSQNGAVMAVNGNAASEHVAGAFRWTRAKGYERLPDLENAAYCRVVGISADGDTIIGSTDRVACFWKKGQVESLGVIAPNKTSWSTAVSQEGSIIAGTSGKTAFVWTRASGVRSLRDVLKAAGWKPSSETFETIGAIFLNRGMMIVSGTGSSGVFVARVKL